tara:strand:- start:23 stop:397 length:375 start_codon:yes stop_codon:yes gene_type:complete
MRNSVLVLVLGLGLASCEKEPLEEVIALESKELTEVVYMGVGIGGLGFTYSEDFNGIIRDLEYHCVVKLKSCNGVSLEGFNFNEKLKINMNESDFPLLCGDTLYFKYEDISTIDQSTAFMCEQN